MHRVETSWKLIEEILWEHAHSVYKALGRPASAEKINRLSEVLQARLPPELERSLLIHNGMRGVGQPCLFNGMELLSTSRITDTWKMRWAVHGKDDSGGCPQTTDRRIKNDQRWRPGWVPFLEENGNMLLIDLDPAPNGLVGQVFKFYNSPCRPRRVIAGSYGMWLNIAAETLVGRKFTLSEHGDMWLDDLEIARQDTSIEPVRG